MGTKVKIPITLDGIDTVTAFGYYPNITTNQPDIDSPPSGDAYAAVDVQECAGTGGASTGANPYDFSVLLSNGSTAKTGFIVGTPTVAPLSSESGLGSSNGGLSQGQCDRGWIVYDIPNGTTATYVEMTGTSASFSANDSVVKWKITG